jgi:hypothetical protein
MMGEIGLDRVRSDLDVMREAAGMDLPFGWEDVWLALAIVPCGAILAGAGAFTPLEMARWAVAPTLLVLLAAVGLRIRFRKSSGRSPIRRREYTLGLVTGLLCAGMAGLFLVWGRRSGVPTSLLGGAVVAFTGVLCIVLALTAVGRRSSFVAGVALIVYGLIIPVSTPAQVVLGGGVAMMLTGLGAAAIQAYQLRAQEAHAAS